MQQAEEYAVRTLRSGITPIVLKFQPVYDCYNGEEIAYIGKPLINSLVYGVLTPELYARAADMAQEGCDFTLCILRKRIIQGAEFPHEIGFFFGYPAEDVFAFIREKGHNYKLVGDWKVYGDGKAALHTFRSYARCRKRLLEQASAGGDIVSLLTPARTGAAI